MVKNNCQIRFSYLCVFDFIILKIDYVNIEKRIFFFSREYKIINCSQDSLTNPLNKIGMFHIYLFDSWFNIYFKIFDFFIFKNNLF
jgi:hypothetical protein